MMFAKTWVAILILLNVDASWGRKRSGSTKSAASTGTCYPGRFLSDEDLRQLENMRVLDSMAELTSVNKRFEFTESCGFTTQNNGRVHLDKCAVQTYHALIKRSAGSCCSTTMYVIQPLQVTDMYTGNTYNVKHLPSAYQLLHAGYCTSEGSPCGAGTCTQSYRVDWVLVEKPSGDDFVPASVPNHCSCVYT